MDCIFCKIARGEIPCTKVYEDESTLAFRDINPQAPVHVVVIPKTHIAGMNDLDALPEKEQLALLHAVQAAAKAAGVAETGYRVVSNCGAHACQSVGHLHLHILGGAQLAEHMA